MSCDLINGRLLAECKEGMAGLKTVFFVKFNDVVPVIETNGEVSGLGTVTAYRFEMGSSLGQAIETLNSAEETGVAYMEQIVTMSLLSIKTIDLPDMNALKKGRWVIVGMGYDNACRVFGVFNGSTATGGDSTSGLAPADAKVLNMLFTSRENDYAPFTQVPAVPSVPYNPFEDFITVTVVPAYT